MMLNSGLGVIVVISSPKYKFSTQHSGHSIIMTGITPKREGMKLNADLSLKQWD